MKKFTLLFALTAILLFSKAFGEMDQIEKASKILKASKLEFIENKGQIADQNGNVNWDVLFIYQTEYIYFEVAYFS